ncbi:SMI1/KNR4 family protein [Sphingomonas sp. NCPPB 2930]
MDIIFKRPGLNEAEIQAYEKLGIKYKKYQKKELLQLSALPHPTEADLQELQIKFGLLPDEYLNFVKKYNGGIPSKKKIVVGRKEVTISSFFPVVGSARLLGGIEGQMETYKNRIPLHSIPIAAISGGDLLLLDLREKTHGCVYLWLHELESEEDADVYYENMELVANSFDELLDKLRD